MHLNFLEYSRLYRLQDGGAVVKRGHRTKNLCIGVRFAFELMDVFIGQFASVFFPHGRRTSFLRKPDGMEILEYTGHFIGVQEFLYGLLYSSEARDYVTSDGMFLAAKAFPRALPQNAENLQVFTTSRDAWDYLRDCIVDDLELRVSPARMLTFVNRFEAVKSLYSRLYNSGLGIVCI